MMASAIILVSTLALAPNMDYTEPAIQPDMRSQERYGKTYSEWLICKDNKPLYRFPEADMARDYKDNVLKLANHPEYYIERDGC